MKLPPTFSLSQKHPIVSGNGTHCRKEEPCAPHIGNRGLGVYVNRSGRQLSDFSGQSPVIRESFDVFPKQPHNQRCNTVYSCSKQSSISGKRNHMWFDRERQPSPNYNYALHEVQKDQPIIETNQCDNLKGSCKSLAVNLQNNENALLIHSPCASIGNKTALPDVKITRGRNSDSGKIVHQLPSLAPLRHDDMRIPQACDDILAPGSAPRRALLTKRPTSAVVTKYSTVSAKGSKQRPQESWERTGEIDIYELPSDVGEALIPALGSTGRKHSTVRIAHGIRKKAAPHSGKTGVQNNQGGRTQRKDSSHGRNCEVHSSKSSSNRTQANIAGHFQPDIPVATNEQPDEILDQPKMEMAPTGCASTVTPVIYPLQCRNKTPCISIGEPEGMSKFSPGCPGFAIPRDQQSVHCPATHLATILQADPIFPGARPVNTVPLAVPHICEPLLCHHQSSHTPINDFEVLCAGSGVPPPKSLTLAIQSIGTEVNTDAFQAPGIQYLPQGDQQTPEGLKSVLRTNDPFARMSQIVPPNNSGFSVLGCSLEAPRVDNTCTPVCTSPEPWPTYESPSHSADARRELFITMKSGIQSLAITIDRNDAERLSKRIRDFLQTDTSAKVHSLSSISLPGILTKSELLYLRYHPEFHSLTWSWERARAKMTILCYHSVSSVSQHLHRGQM